MFFYSKNFVSLPSRSVGNHRGKKMGTDVYEFMIARCIFRVDISGYDRDILFIKKSWTHILRSLSLRLSWRPEKVMIWIEQNESYFWFNILIKEHIQMYRKFLINTNIKSKVKKKKLNIVASSYIIKVHEKNIKSALMIFTRSRVQSHIRHFSYESIHFFYRLLT